MYGYFLVTSKWAGGLAVAELELEATHAYALIMSFGGSLPTRLSNCKLKREAGLNSW